MGRERPDVEADADEGGPRLQAPTDRAACVAAPQEQHQQHHRWISLTFLLSPPLRPPHPNHARPVMDSVFLQNYLSGVSLLLSHIADIR